MKIVIVDYDSGNLHSAEKAFAKVADELGNREVIVTDDADVIASADYLLLPGDGAFPACRKALMTKTGVFDAIDHAVSSRGIPFLGICVGMQMLGRDSDEYELTSGFGWIDGHVREIPAAPSLKVPHMGWNDLVITQDHPIMADVRTGAHVYFVHSYHMEMTAQDQRIAHCAYGTDLTAIVGRDNILGFQFHPEKSQAGGLTLIKNFLTWAP
jgi:glutamine amidotransferase